MSWAGESLAIGSARTAVNEDLDKAAALLADIAQRLHAMVTQYPARIYIVDFRYAADMVDSAWRAVGHAQTALNSNAPN